MNLFNWMFRKLQTPARPQLMLVVAIIGLMVAMMIPRKARAGTVFVPNWYKVYSTTLSPSATSNLTTTVFQDVLIPAQGEAMFLQITPTNTMQTQTITAKCDVTPDGTNWTTAQTYQILLTPNGTNQIMVYTNYPHSGSAPTLNNAKAIALTGLVNGSTNFVPLKFWFSHMNQ